ncbi:MAG: site-specific integrase, partial [Candidatus Bathyarchaeota archaeon]|nr:site-specific integrase [Candidatus Bathyarchaeota archaeon]
RIFQVLWQMRKDGYSENTIKPIGRRLRNLGKHADLDNPEKVKEFIVRVDWSNGYKENIVNAYNHYAVFHCLEWRKPRHQRAFSIKKLPLESDIDLIISYTRTRNRVAFKLVKECGLRPIEVSRLTLKQIDLHKGLVYPETAKGGEARVLRIKKETLALLKQLVSNMQSVNKEIFPSSKTLQSNWFKLRKRIAETYNKQELKQVRLYDLRHFYGTMLYHKTRDIVHVQRKMGHRSLKNTLIYIDLADFDTEEEFISKVAQTPKEIQQLIEADSNTYVKRTDRHSSEKGSDHDGYFSII